MDTHRIHHDYKPGEITDITNRLIAETDERIAELVAQPHKEFSNTIEGYEDIITAYNERFDPVSFMMDVHTSADIRKDAENARDLSSTYLVGLESRKDLFNALHEADATTPRSTLSPVQRRLSEQTLLRFKRNGLDLPDDKRERVTALKKELAILCTKFEANLGNNTDTAAITPADIEGAPETFLKRLKRGSDGEYIVEAKSSDVVPFMENVKSGDARYHVLDVWERREASNNNPLLRRALDIRAELADLLGYPTWADYSTEIKMTKNAKTAQDFLVDLRRDLAPLTTRDMKELIDLKYANGSDEPFRQWDIMYYANQLLKQKHDIDSDEIRKYFPADHVVPQLLGLASDLFGVRFEEIPADAWHPSVRLFATSDAASGETIGHIYTDLYPRDGKYSHAMAQWLRRPYSRGEKRALPINAIVANFAPPSDGQPSLLSHEEVETFFHEFGHIMHMTLAKPEYSTMGVAGVAWDFVEVPSQMMENWVWDKRMLQTLSRHYENGSPLPDDLIDRMIAARNASSGVWNMRQLVLGTLDMQLHTERGLDPTETHKDIYRGLMGIEPLADTQMPASFGHIMGGYEAGYYGYMWSKAFAQDLFSRFEREGVRNPRVGMEYRKTVLEPGDSRDAIDLAREFLGREPNNDAFVKSLGL